MIAAAKANTIHVFGPPHLVAIALTFLVPIGLVLLARKGDSARRTRNIARSLALALILCDLLYRGTGLLTWPLKDFLREALPLHICGVATYLTAIVLLSRSQFLFEVVYFFGLAGTLQAIITPDEVDAFPSFEFLQFFVRHCLIVIGVLFATCGMAMRPRARGIIQTFVVGNVYLLVIAGVNYLGGWNYMYLCEKPKSVSPLLFADWPWYILFLELVGLVLFTMLYAPFPLARRLRGRKRTASAETSGQGPPAPDG